MSVWVDLVVVLRRYVAVSFFINSRMDRIPDSLYIMMELVSLGSRKMQRSGTLGILSNVCKAELQAIRRTGAAYSRTDCIRDLYRV